MHSYESAVVSVLGKFVTGVLGRHVSCLVFRWLGLPPVPYSVG